ncbi:hypothetical protein OROHE_022901 [Orobanche hederae]
MPSQLRNTKPCSSAGQSAHVYLPQEIIEEILSRLPVKSLLRFRCVSKSWLCLFGSTQFVKTHLQNLARNTSFSHHKVIFSVRDGGLKQYSLQSLLNDGPNPIPTGLCSNGVVETGDHIVGCCNGLVCIVKEGGKRVLLWNPSTRISKEVPHHDHDDHSIHTCAFGWDEWSGAYKVIVVLCSVGEQERLYKVYSSRTNSWKNVDGLEFCSHPGQFANGKLHLFGLNVEIVTFDLKTDVFGTMELPDKPDDWHNHSAAMGVLGGCLSLCYVYAKDLDGHHKQRLDLWVMKKHESWVKVMAVPFYWEFVMARPLCISPNAEIILICPPFFFVHHPKHNVILPLNDFEVEAPLLSHLYVESLVSPHQQS